MPIKILIYGFLLFVPPLFVYFLGKRLIAHLPPDGPARILAFHGFRQQARRIQMAAIFLAVFLFVAADLGHLLGRENPHFVVITIILTIVSVNTVFFKFDREVRRTTAGFFHYARIYFGAFFILAVTYSVIIKLLFLIQGSIAHPARLLYWTAWLVVVVYGTPALSPLFMRLLYKIKPLQEPVLKERLEGFLRKIQLRCGDILQFETDGLHYSNAVVSGILPNYRYIYFSSYLLKRLNPSEIEAVFAHETAHIKKNHILMKSHLVFFLYLTVIPLAYFVHAGFQAQRAFYIAQWLPIVVFCVTYGILSRIMAKRHERECDEFVVDHCPSAADLESALQKIYADNYMPPQSPSSSHPALSQRLKYIQERKERKPR